MGLDGFGWTFFGRGGGGDRFFFVFDFLWYFFAVF